MLNGSGAAHARSACEFVRSAGSMIWKAACAALVAAALLPAAPAKAQAIDLAKMKCKNFIELSKDTIATITVWLDGYYTDEEDAAVLEPDKLKAIADKLTAYCAQNPKLGLMLAAETVMAK
jgi:acid stress chaperone HdeB